MSDQHIDIEWNGIFNPEEEAAVREQLSDALHTGELNTCHCGRVMIAVFGDRMHLTFDGFLYCECGQQFYTHLNGLLPPPADHKSAA